MLQVILKLYFADVAESPRRPWDEYLPFGGVAFICDQLDSFLESVPIKTGSLVVLFDVAADDEGRGKILAIIVEHGISLLWIGMEGAV